MKIINFSAYDRYNGASTRSFDICRGLSKIGCETIFVTNNYCHFEKKYHSLEPKINDGVYCDYLKTPMYYKTPGRFYNMLVNFLKIIKYKRINGIDFVIGPSVPITTGLAAYIYSRFVGAKYVYEIRDVWPIALVKLGAISKYNPIYYIFLLIEKFLYRNSELIISTLPNVKDHIVNGSKCIPNLHYIPNPISNDLLKANTNFSYLNAVHGSSSPVFKYVGGFGVVHDVETLVKAAIYYLNNFDAGANFIFIGDGVKHKYISKIVQSSGFSNNIKLLGYLPKNLSLIEAMDADVLLAAVPDSEIFEFGINLNKLYLYLSAGVPIAFAGTVKNDIVSINSFGNSVPAEDYVALAFAMRDLCQIDKHDRAILKGRMRIYIEKNLAESVICKNYYKILTNQQTA